MKSAKNVHSYIKDAPKPTQAKLKQLRKIIRTVAHQAEEKLSYGMPYYGYNGPLAYFAWAKAHIGLYLPPPVIKQHEKELQNYVTAKATVQFPLDQKLPITLIKKLVKARMKLNESK